MKTTKIASTLLLLAACFQGFAQTENTDGVSISNNNVPPHENAILHVMSDLTTPKKGMIIPRMTFQEMLDIVPVNMATPPSGNPDGLFVYVTSGGYEICDEFERTADPGCIMGSPCMPGLWECGEEPEFKLYLSTLFNEEYHGLWYWDNAHPDLVNGGFNDPTPTIHKWRKVGGDHRWYVNDDGEVYRDDTYIGIGTSNPENLLTINGKDQSVVPLAITGYAENWSSNNWKVRLETPINAMWRCSEPNSAGDYLGTGMTSTGWYWTRNQDPDGSSSPMDYPMALTLSGATSTLSLNENADLFLDDDAVPNSGVDLYGNVANSVLEVRTGNDVQLQIGRKNGGANEINSSFQVHLEYTGGEVWVGGNNGWDANAQPANLQVWGPLQWIVRICS